MAFDPKNNLTYTQMYASKSLSTNNTATNGVDLRGYEGPVAVRVNFGVKTVGDNDGTVTVFLQSAANNTASEATNISVGNVTTSNNTAAGGTLQVDPRACYRWLFGRITFTGTNTPTYPVSMELVGVKQVQ